MRLLFGGGIADWALTADEDTGVVSVVAAATITFWNQEVGGTQFTDLTTVGGDPISTVASSAGGDGLAVGQIPPFYGPDGAFQMWADANEGDGPRALMTAANLGEFVAPVRTQLQEHLSTSNVNPHMTTLASLPDVGGMESKSTGQVMAVASDGLVKPTTVAGIGNSVLITGDQTVGGVKRFEHQAAPAATRIVVQAAESQSVDVLQVWSSAAAGQGAAVAKTAAFNEKGEARFRPARSDSVAVQFAAQSGQTANVFEQTASNGSVLARMEANGVWRAPNLGRTIAFSKAGALTTGAGTFTWYNDLGVTLTVRSVRATVNTAPTGSAVIVDVNLGGTTIFGTQANRPTIAATTKTNKSTGMSVTTIPDGGAVTVDIDAIGSTVAGSDLVVAIEVY